MNAGHRLQKQTYLPLNPGSSQWGTQGRTDAITTCIPTNDPSSAAVGSGAKESQAEEAGGGVLRLENREQDSYLP